MARPVLGSEEVAAVRGVLDSAMLVQGVHVRRFEALVAETCEREHAVAVSSGTAALHLALKAVGVGSGDRVLCPDLTWPSPAHAILACGAEPVLVDVDAEEWNVTPAIVASAGATGVRALVAIDQFGNPARVSEIEEAMRKWDPGPALVVDAACSLGSALGSGPCGGFGHVACLSFHPRKVVTTGEGGMCLTNDQGLAEEIRCLRNHGLDRSGVFQRASGNFRMTDLAAAIGVVQVSRLAELVKKRRELAARYREELRQRCEGGPFALAFQSTPNGGWSNYQTFGVLLPESSSANQRDEAVKAMADLGVQAGRLSYALHKLKPLERFGRAAVRSGRPFRVSARIDERGLALPMYPELTRAGQDRVIEALLRALDE